MPSATKSKADPVAMVQTLKDLGRQLEEEVSHEVIRNLNVTLAELEQVLKQRKRVGRPKGKRHKTQDHHVETIRAWSEGDKTQSARELARSLGLSHQTVYTILADLKKDTHSPICFTKVKMPYGWMGNMSPYSIISEGKEYRTAEHLFQCLRFDDAAAIAEIMGETRPMAAKFAAKRNAAKMVVTPASEQDVMNMERVLRLKLEQHPQLKEALRQTGTRDIIEDSTHQKSSRRKFWGAALENGEWVGDNVMGKLWMKLREELFCQDS